MKSIITIILLFAGFSLSAQIDPVAKGILDKFSNAALSSPSVEMKFTLRIEDKIEGTEQVSDGHVVFRENMYMLQLPENIIWYDGSSMWTLSPEVNEVTVTLPDPGEDIFITSPSSLFDMYKGDFKYRMLEELPEGSLIDLYPGDPSTTDFSIIRLLIDKQNRLVSAEYRRKDGIDIFIDVLDYNLGKSYPDSFFSFDPSAYPGVDIIDMR
ncbi:MAG: outer membrane lipoprotein carrier protein LolA [Bacteroidales bacterium]|nr:outer membrane lipoprotein carrier protein LolA [Bacteroidales bacterium]